MSLIRLDTVEPKPLQWLWYPRLPAGRLSILLGHPDRGKSICAGMCAAHVSRQRAWPDGAVCPSGKVIILEAEDSLEETIVPRLIAAEADLTNIFTWPERNLAALPEHLQTISPSLVILSPLNTYLPQAVHTWNDRNVRAALQPLSDLASKSGAAILGIMHPPKHQQALPIHAVGGSVAFGAVARSVLIVERTQDGLYLMEALKKNLTEFVPPIGYRIVPAPTDPTIPVLRWELVAPTMSLVPPDEEQGALVAACEYLEMALDDGPVSSTSIRFGAEKQGIGWRTITRARKLLGIRATKVYCQDKSHWELFFPPKPPLSKPDA